MPRRVEALGQGGRNRNNEDDGEDGGGGAHLQVRSLADRSEFFYVYICTMYDETM